MNVIKYITFYILSWLDASWFLMLGIGIIHRNWWHAVPLMGFPTALILGFLFGSMLTGGGAVTYAAAKGWLNGRV